MSSRYRDYLKAKAKLAWISVWGVVGALTTTLGLIAPICEHYRPEWFAEPGGRKLMIGVWLSILPIAVGLSVFAIRWLWAGYRIWNVSLSDCATLRAGYEGNLIEQRAKFEYELGAIRQKHFEEQVQRSSDEDAQIKKVADGFAKNWDVDFSSEQKEFDRLSAVISAGLLGLEEIPMAARKVEKALLDHHGKRADLVSMFEADRVIPFARYTTDVPNFDTFTYWEKQGVWISFLGNNPPPKEPDPKAAYRVLMEPLFEQADRITSSASSIAEAASVLPPPAQQP